LKKTTKIVSIALIAIIIVVAITSVILYYPMSIENAEPQVVLPAGNAPEWQIKVSGNVQQEKTWSLNEITQMPLTRVIAEYNGENATFGGVALTDFCNKTGSLWDTETINIKSADGKSVSLNIFQAWNSTSYPYYQEHNRIILAFIEDDEWMTQETGGPVKLITPSFGAEYQIESVAEMNLDKWTISISGAVSNPLTITSSNLTSFEQQTLHGAFVPGDGERTSDWTGLSMLGVLESAGMSDRADKITIVAIDGYAKNYTLREVAKSSMLIGFEENGNHLTQSQGGPYRLFCPVEEYKWAQFWVKFVSEIIVT
jgi:DMSO/TMAO reductase YedYZ molybdopterin-dependent catalytic subunit